MARQPADKVSRYLSAAEKKLTKRLHTAGDDVEALHRARKAGKRYRYATELALPVVGKKATKTIKTAKKLQELLGAHQDSVVSATFLRQHGAAAGVNPDQNGFTYGLLLAHRNLSRWLGPARDGVCRRLWRIGLSRWSRFHKAPRASVVVVCVLFGLVRGRDADR